MNDKLLRDRIKEAQCELNKAMYFLLNCPEELEVIDGSLSCVLSNVCDAIEQIRQEQNK